MRRTMRRVGVLAAAVVMLTAIAVPAQGAGGDKDGCKVKNLSTRVDSSDLQSQIDDADPGDTLKIRGVCVGNFTIPTGAALTLLGKERAGVPATLDGDGWYRPTLWVEPSSDVTVTDLVITGGGVCPGCGGGIQVQPGATVTLNGETKVSGNLGYVGGGIRNYGGTVNLHDSAQVSGNESLNGGGGISNNRGTLTLSGYAQVSQNTAPHDNGGGIFNYLGTVTLSGHARVSQNTVTSVHPSEWEGHGGGILNRDGTLALGDYVQVSQNTALTVDPTQPLGRGGGIANYDDGVLTLSGGAQVIGNTADADGGGIWNIDGTVTLNTNATVIENTAGGWGGGIFSSGDYGSSTVTLSQAAKVMGNSAGSHGGGISIRGGELTLDGYAYVSGNTADADGGGIWNGGTASMSSSSDVTGNTADADDGGEGTGGGIYGCVSGAVAGGNVFDNYRGTTSPVPDNIANGC